MTHDIFIKAFIACLIGNILHVAIRCVRLQREMKKDPKMPNFDFVVWLKADKWVLIADVLFSFAMVYAADEFLVGDIGRIALEKVKTLFIFVGMGGSSILIGLFSTFREKMKATGINIEEDK